jgi:hypothetical protein
MPYTIGLAEASGDVAKSPDGTGDSRSLTYHITGGYDEATILALVEAAAPATYLANFRNTIKLKHTEGGIWQATVDYTPRKPPDLGEFEFSFDITTENTRITHSLATRNRYPAGTAPDLKGAIGWDGRKLAGCEILVPKCVINYSYTIDAAVAGDATWQRNLSYAVGKMNSAEYKGYSAGELLLFNAKGSESISESTWKIAVSFAVSKNKTGMTIGGITGISKKGWDYLWTKWKPVLDAGIKKIEAEAVYVEQVYEETDFNDIAFA